MPLTKAEIVERIAPLLTAAPSPSHEMSITCGSLATLADLDWEGLFQGGKSAEQRRIAELEAQLAEARAAAPAAAPQPTAPPETQTQPNPQPATETPKAVAAEPAETPAAPVKPAPLEAIE